jgi:hypothetical protein
MTNEEILEKAFKKAVSGGFPDDKLPWCQECAEDYYRVIFSHDFAKAFWGEEPITYDTGTSLPIWKDRLMCMVIEEDPIRYLEKFLDKEDSGTRA